MLVCCCYPASLSNCYYYALKRGFIVCLEAQHLQTISVLHSVPPPRPTQAKCQGRSLAVLFVKSPQVVLI